jgi:hypothetical protein
MHDPREWTPEVFRRLLDFLNRLVTAHIHYTLGHTEVFSATVTRAFAA